ncbi:unnamed protein product [Trifolium pratense]|uniref:Uncharacterized protein n=1 Tax=Trifolium pratense TaxID=57577 RepID=A0ACB0LX94_TRIPR|nr:unnamed protein product [Trifolium pratense]
MDRQTTTIIIIDLLPSNIISGHQDAKSSKQILDMCFPPFTCHHHHPPSLVKLYLLHQMNRQTTTVIIGDLPPSKIISGHHNADLPPSKVDYACTAEIVRRHFQSCGIVNRVIILTNEFSLPKDCAYVEFLKIDDVPKALLLNESELHGRKIKVYLPDNLCKTVNTLSYVSFQISVIYVNSSLHHRSVLSVRIYSE